MKKERTEKPEGHMTADSALLERNSKSCLRGGILRVGTELCQWETQACNLDISEGRIEKLEPRYLGKMGRNKTDTPLL